MKIESPIRKRTESITISSKPSTLLLLISMPTSNQLNPTPECPSWAFFRIQVNRFPSHHRSKLHIVESLRKEPLSNFSRTLAANGERWLISNLLSCMLSCDRVAHYQIGSLEINIQSVTLQQDNHSTTTLPLLHHRPCSQPASAPLPYHSLVSIS